MKLPAIFLLLGAALPAQTLLYVSSPAHSAGIPGEIVTTGPAAACDVDGDGDPDLVLEDDRDPGRRVALLLNDGLGRFAQAPAGWLPPVSSRAWFLVPVDADGDGDPDLFLGAIPGMPHMLLLNDGTGRFRAAPADFLAAVGDRCRSCAFGDADGDGSPDLVAAHDSSHGGYVEFYLNDGQGRFADAPREWLVASTAVFHWPLLAALADLDRDGDLDCVLGGSGSPPDPNYYTVALRNDGRGRFSGWGPLYNERIGAARLVADLDRDGFPDLITADGRQECRLYMNQQGLSFREDTSNRLNLPIYPLNITHVRDLNGDGAPEIVLDDGTIHWNDGRGFFTALPPTRGGFPAGFLYAVGDFDGDGDEDLLLDERKPPLTYHPRILWSTRRQLASLGAPGLGRTWVVDAYAWDPIRPRRRAGIPLLAGAPGLLALPPLGTLRLDPGRTFALSPFLAPARVPTVRLGLFVPPDPLLLGLRFRLQVLYLAYPSCPFPEDGFSNAVEEAIGP